MSSILDYVNDYRIFFVVVVMTMFGHFHPIIIVVFFVFQILDDNRFHLIINIIHSQMELIIMATTTTTKNKKQKEKKAKKIK